MSRKSVCSRLRLSAIVRKFAVLVFTSISIFGQFAAPTVTVGGIAPLDEQTGYFPQPLRVTNPGTTTYPGLRVLIRDLPLDTATNVVRVANAHGLTNKIPFFEYGPIAPGASVDFTIELYVSNRRTLPSPTYEVLVQEPRPFFGAKASLVNTNATYFDVVSGRPVAQFKTTENGAYFIQYNTDLTATNGWKTSLPGLLGNGHVVQWVDTGPPRTDTPPGGQGSRFYRVILVQQ
jgi:hypothetical protein